MLPEFQIVDGLVTVEPISPPSWLIRGRESDDSPLSPYRWSLTLAQAAPGVCVFKGYCARAGGGMTLSDLRALYRIAFQLGFSVCRYERRDSDGRQRKVVEILDLPGSAAIQNAPGSTIRTE